MDDTQLLLEYVDAGSEAAFAELVRRHIDMVYAAARRQTRDPHLAEDVTQAVFIVLARKAAKVRSGAVLPAWLLSSTRYAASNVMSAQFRRRRHESKAAAMAPTVIAAPDHDAENDDALAATLDQAMARLGEADRSAVALRYLQNKSFSEVAAAMKVTEEAARKRVVRAVEKLRGYFTRRGVAMNGTELDSRLLRQLSHAAPAALAPVVIAKALSAKSLALGVGGAGTCGTIADAVIRSLTWAGSGKIAAAAIVAVVVTVGGAVAVKQRGAGGSAKPQAAMQASAQLTAEATSATATTSPTGQVMFSLNAEQVWQPYVPNDTPGTDVLPIKNETLIAWPGNIPDYFGGVDESVHRNDGPPAAHVQSLAAVPKGKPQVVGGDAAASGALLRTLDAKPYRGKRIRLAGYLKCTGVAQRAAMALLVFGTNGRAIAQDDMGGHWLFGDTDWARYDIVEDVSDEAATIVAQGVLTGPGELWLDGLELSVVGKDVPVNDDHRWRSWTPLPAKYKTSLDQTQRRNGHATIKVTSDSPGIGPNEWNTYDRTLEDVKPYLGKRIRFSVWIKSKDVVANAGPSIRAVGPANSTAARDEGWLFRPVRGTSDWKLCTTYLNVPAKAMDISMGVTMNRKGTIWFDDLKLEIVE